MKKLVLMLMTIIGMSFNTETIKYIPFEEHTNVNYKKLLYDDVWGAIYHAEVR